MLSPAHDDPNKAKEKKRKKDEPESFGNTDFSPKKKS